MARLLGLPQHRFALPGVHLHHCRSGQAAMRAVHHRHHDLQIAHQLRDARRRGGFRFRLPLRFEEQIRRIEDALADRRRAIAPGGIQLPGFARIAVMRCEDRGHPLAVLQVDAGHRHQELHRDVRRDFALPHLLLDRFGQEFDQRQPARHPAHAAVEPTGQLIQSVSEALLQLLKQPALFQCGLLLRQPQRTVQQQSLGFAHRPDHRFHRIPPQLLECRDAFVAVDDQVTVGLAGGGHHHDRRLLPRFGQRGQQPPLALPMAHAQVLPAPIGLVKFQLHGGCPVASRFSMEPAGTGLFRREREVGWELSWNQ